mmetsp:Transcript_70464/g.210105  ORF Transcript_70464/g.210105 Transcript_70464/m.210105 type:complete len:416 (+) Transcript_70464:36-1283(+)
MGLLKAAAVPRPVRSPGALCGPSPTFPAARAARRLPPRRRQPSPQRAGESGGVERGSARRRLAAAGAFVLLGGLVARRPLAWVRSQTQLRRLIARAQPTRAEAAGEADDVMLGEDAEMSLRRVVRASVAKTLMNVLVWSILAMVFSYVFYSSMQHLVWSVFTGMRNPVELCDVSLGYLGHFLAIMSLLFSILAGNSYTALYSQNEAIFTALFAEVSEAKALMEQIALVCSGRPFYRSALENIQRYVERDLKRLDQPPAVLVACKPRDDPLESILYLTSVGVPSAVYETVRTLRQRRGDRLGAVQRKLPPVQIALLYVLGALNLLSFLLLATGSSQGQLCRCLFALLVGAMMMTMRVIHELWTPVGGAYNVDGVLTIMIRGLMDELQQRLQGRTFSDTRLPPPPPRWNPGRVAQAG